MTYTCDCGRLYTFDRYGYLEHRYCPDCGQYINADKVYADLAQLVSTLSRRQENN